MTADDFREIALSFPETVEASHMCHPDFRVRGKIFATLAHPDNGFGMVQLTPEQQQTFILAHPGMFQPVNGKWGLGGSTHVILAKATRPVVRQAMAEAWGKASAAKRSRKTV
jgi:hypothetical protein